MGVETDQEIVQMVGSTPIYAMGLAPSLEECSKLGIKTQLQVTGEGNGPGCGDSEGGRKSNRDA